MTSLHYAKNGTAYTLRGPKGCPTLVLIHGLGLDRNTWKDYQPVLEADYQVLNLDLFGHGKSAPPPQTPSLTLFSEQILSLIDELSIEQAVLIGFSLGGMINRRFALDHGNRLLGLVILNSPHERGDKAQKIVEQRAMQTAAAGPGANIEETLARWFTPSFRESNGAVVEEIRQGVLANDAITYAQCRWVLANGVVELIRPEQPISIPTLVMTCEHDSGSTVAMSRAIASEIPNAKIEVLPSLQHMGLVEDPSAFLTPILHFLKNSLSREISRL